MKSNDNNYRNYNMNQRNSGHNWERKLTLMLTTTLKIPFVTARSESKRTDDRGVDFVCEDSSFPIEFQAKEQTIPEMTKSYSVKIESLDTMQTEKERALLIRLWRKGKSRRKLQGHYMVVPLELGLEMVDAYVKRREDESRCAD